jgi:hypothetical protein
MYSLKIQDDIDKKTAKGVKKSIKDNKITHNDYLNTLMTCTHKPEHKILLDHLIIMYFQSNKQKLDYLL